MRTTAACLAVLGLGLTSAFQAPPSRRSLSLSPGVGVGLNPNPNPKLGSSPLGGGLALGARREESMYELERTRRVPPAASIGFDESGMRVADMPLPVQWAVLAAIAAGLFAGTSAILGAFGALHDAAPGLFDAWKNLTWPVPLGLIFALAGVAHFTNKDDFAAIVPPRGTWGLWEVPMLDVGMGYEEFHTVWTGVAEICGGLLLASAGIGKGLVSVQVAAGLLLLLTICVTPANVYMFTHDAQMGSLPPVKGAAHLFRGVMQCVLFAFFYTLATT